MPKKPKAKAPVNDGLDPTVVVSVRLPRETVEALRQREAATGVPVPNLIRRAITDLLNAKPRILR